MAATSAMATERMEAEVDAAANRPNTFVPAGCKCFVCTALAAREDSPWTRALTWRDDELYPNIVGFRRRDSIHNKFDDRLLVFMRPMATNVPQARTRDALREAVGADLLADLKQCVGAASAHVRVCRCKAIGGAQPGVWIVLWLVITTDPGETIDAAYKKLLRAVTALEEKAPPLPPEATPPEVTHDTPAQAKRRVQLEEARAKLRQYEDDPAHRRVVFRVKGGAQGGSGHGITDRRGMMALGQVRDQFQIGLHHRDRVIFGDKGAQVALICRKPAGFRMWTGAAVREATPDPSHPGSARSVQHQKFSTSSVVRHGVHGALDGVPWTQTKRLVWDVDRWFVVDDAAEGARVEVQADDVLFLADAGVAGTNHHRAHSVRVNGGALEEGTPAEFGGGDAENSAAVSKQLATWGPPRQEVNGWSEGCQVNPGFYAFNLFLRLVTLSTRWRCHAGKTRAAHCAVLEAGAANALSDTELCLFSGPDRAASAWRQYLDVLLTRYRELASARALADRKVTASELAEQQAKEAKKPSPKAIAKAEAAHQSAQKAQADTEARATAFVHECPWIQRYDDAVRPLEKATEELKAANAMKKSNPKREDAIARAKAAHEESAGVVDTLAAEISQPESLRRAAVRHFRLYTPVMQKQFVRGCDLDWGCKSYLDYTLVEVTDEDIDMLDKRFTGRLDEGFGEASTMVTFDPDTALVIG
jgi:hypothetical protein